MAKKPHRFDTVAIDVYPYQPEYYIQQGKKVPEWVKQGFKCEGLYKLAMKKKKKEAMKRKKNKDSK